MHPRLPVTFMDNAATVYLYLCEEGLPRAHEFVARAHRRVEAGQRRLRFCRGRHRRRSRRHGHAAATHERIAVRTVASALPCIRGHVRGLGAHVVQANSRAVEGRPICMACHVRSGKARAECTMSRRMTVMSVGGGSSAQHECSSASWMLPRSEAVRTVPAYAVLRGDE